jgi:hypothetical protein
MINRQYIFNKDILMKAKLLITSVVSVFLLAGCGVANETTQCTSEPNENWMEQQEFKNSLTAQGYKIKEFKVTEGNCYELYGSDVKGSKVEIYFNPVDGSVVKQENH